MGKGNLILPKILFVGVFTIVVISYSGYAIASTTGNLYLWAYGSYFIEDFEWPSAEKKFGSAFSA
jgi:hypothetical protein